MARSPLMRRLQQLARDHAEASWRGVDVARVREERAVAFAERRRFLQGVGAVAAAALFSRTQAAKAGVKQPRVAIVGAGIAGLNAALTLQDAGFASTIYESSNRIGGRMHSNTTTWQNGQKSEWCGELIDSGHTTILGLASRFGLTVLDEIAAQPAGSSDTLYFGGHFYSQAQADRDFVPVNAVLQRQINAAPSTVYNSYTPTGYYLDKLSVYEWIEKFVPGGHGSELGRYLDSAYNQEYGLDTQVQSSLNLVYLLGYQPTSGPWQIYGVSDERYSIAGGNQLLPQAIATSLPPSSVVLQHALTSIQGTGRGGYILTFTAPSGSSAVEADEVILTVPFSVLRRLDYSSAGFDSLKKIAIQQLGYGTNTKLSLQFSKRYWNTTGVWGIGDGNIYTDLFFQNTWDSSRGRPLVTCPAIGTLYGSSVKTRRAGGSPCISRRSVSGSVALPQARRCGPSSKTSPKRDGVSLGRERTLLDCVSGVAKDDLVDLVGSEAGDLDRCVVEDQLFELDLERVEVPLAFFAETIGGEAHDVLHLLAQVFHPDARHAAEAEEPRRLDPHGAVEDEIVLADEGSAHADSSRQCSVAVKSRVVAYDLLRGAASFLGAALHEALKVDRAVFAGKMAVPLTYAFVTGEGRVLADLPT